MTHVMALTPGTELVGDFRIERVLGAGGFGITYLADEIALARTVTIKEYFPSDFAARGSGQGAVPRSSDCAGDYKWGLDRFIEEAQTLARFDHRNICRVYRYFRANNTGYMVLKFEEGSSLKSWLKGLGRAPRQTEIDKLTGPLLEALEVIHKAEFLHRDIAPDNIMVRADGSPVLIDFGSARGDIARHSRAVSALVKPGYSPYEQYAETGARQGPWSDIYALGATLYHAITGKRPPDSPSRVVSDEYVRAKDAALASYRPRFLAAIDRALDLDIGRRPQTVAEWRVDLLTPEPRAKAAKKGWLSGDETQAAADSTNKAAPAAEAENGAANSTPPVPRGGIIEFFEGLKRKGKPKPMPVADVQPQATVVITAGLKPPPPPPSVKLMPVAPVEAKVEPQPVKRGKAKPAIKSLPPPPVNVDVPPPMPRPRPAKAKRGGFGRKVAAALLLCAGLASAALGLRDKLPSFDAIKSSPLITGSTVPVTETIAVLEMKGHAGGTVGVGFSGDQIVTAGGDGMLLLWNGTSGALQRTINGSGSPINALAVLARRAVTGHADGSAILWNLDRGDRIASFKRNEASIWAVAFAGAADRVVTASHDWSAAIWESASALAPVQLLEGHESAAQAVAFSARGPFVASGSADRLLKLWNVETGSLVRTYRGHKDFITAVDFSADGRLVASAGLDGSIRVWSTASSRLVGTLSGHRGRISAVAFAPSGETLASAGDDGTLRLWDARRGRQVRMFPAAAEQAGGLKALAFSANGRRLAAGGDGGTVIVREIEPSPSTARAGKD